MTIPQGQNGEPTELHNPFLECLTEETGHLASLVFTDARNLRLQPADADDVVQDVIVASLEAANGSKTGDVRNPRAWSITVGRRKSLDIIRTRTKRTTKPLSPTLPCPTDAQPDARIMLAELQSKVRSAVSRLPKKYKELVEFRYLNGGTIDEAAEAFRISRSAIRNCLNRAKKRLARELIELN